MSATTGATAIITISAATTAPPSGGNSPRTAGLTFTPEQIDALIEADVTLWTRLLDPRMLAWIESLQNAGLRTAILSNMVGEVLGRMRRDFSWLGGFTQLTWSCELGIAKPDPAIYLHTCEKLGVRPEEALFLDDKPVNVHAAEQVGLHALHFRSVDQLRADLAAHHLLQSLPQPGEDPVQTPRLTWSQRCNP